MLDLRPSAAVKTGPAWWTVAIGMITALSLAVITAGVVRSWILDDAGREQVLVARLAALQIDQTIRTAKVILDGAAARLGDNASLLEGARRVVEEMAPQLAHDAQFVGLKVVDASGALLLASSADESAAWPPPVPPDFYVGSSRATGSFHLGFAQQSTVDRRPVMTVGRRVTDGDGRLIAVIGLSIDLARLREISDEVLSLRDRTLIIIRADGIALFRLPDPGFALAGMDLSHRPAYRRFAKGETTGYYTTSETFDGVGRVTGFALSPGRELLVTASRAESDVLRLALFSRGQVALWLGAFALVAIGFGAYAAAELRRRRQLIGQREDLLHCLNVADAGIAIADARTQALRFVNPAFERMTGYSAAEVLGKNCRVLQGPETDPATVARIRENLRNGKPVRVDILNYHKDGTPYWSDLNIAPIRASDGAINGFVGAFLDVTERVRMTADLNDALTRAHAADRAKSAFLARMSHELRTPLNAIIGFAEIIGMRLMGPLSDRYVNYAGDIRDSGTHLLALVESILEISRLEADARPFEKSAVDLAEVAHAAATLARPAIDGAAAHLEVEKLGPAPVVGDATALRQIAVNLLVNAARHGRKGGRIVLRTGATPDGFARLTVLDDGPGFPDDVLASVGVPFSGRRSEIADSSGLGLGLAISMDLAKRMGGALEVVNANPGARVTLDLPIADPARNAA